VLLRTDFSTGSNEAWAAFCDTVRAAEAELAEEEGSSSSSSSSGEDEDADADLEMQDAGDAEPSSSTSSELLYLDPPPPQHTLFSNASNIRALRVLSDILHTGPKHTETYAGPQLFLFDARSRTDGAARCVNAS